MRDHLDPGDLRPAGAWIARTAAAADPAVALLDRHTISIDEQIAELEAQTHRRIIKTHTPLDGLPCFPEVSYIFCGRDPRDAFLSFIDHLANVSPQAMVDINRRMGAPEDRALDVDANQLFPLWSTTGSQQWAYDGAPFGLPMLYMVES